MHGRYTLPARGRHCGWGASDLPSYARCPPARDPTGILCSLAWLAASESCAVDLEWALAEANLATTGAAGARSLFVRYGLTTPGGGGVLSPALDRRVSAIEPLATAAGRAASADIACLRPCRRFPRHFKTLLFAETGLGTWAATHIIAPCSNDMAPPPLAESPLALAMDPPSLAQPLAPRRRRRLTWTAAVALASARSGYLARRGTARRSHGFPRWSSQRWLRSWAPWRPSWTMRGLWLLRTTSPRVNSSRRFHQL